MADEKWSQIFSAPLATGLPAAKRVDTQRVTHPTCEENCSGRHAPEGVMQCNKCRTVGYVVYAHEWQHSDGHYFYSREPRNGAPMPPVDVCQCGGAFVRVL